MINQKTSIKWDSYLATAYAEGFCEGENATVEEQFEAWAYIIKHELYKSLQGWFGRTCRDFIESGIITPAGVINWDLIEKETN